MIVVLTQMQVTLCSVFNSISFGINNKSITAAFIGSTTIPAMQKQVHLQVFLKYFPSFINNNDFVNSRNRCWGFLFSDTIVQINCEKCTNI